MEDNSSKSSLEKNNEKLQKYLSPKSKQMMYIRELSPKGEPENSLAKINIEQKNLKIYNNV